MTKAHSTRRRHATLLSLLSAHRLKATVASIVAVAGVLVSMGVVDTSKLPPWANDLLAQTGIVLPVPLTPPVVASADTTMSTCYTPGQNCTNLVVNAIASAKTELLVQAYGFTSTAIIEAIGAAKARGIKVSVILDKTNESEQDSGAVYLKEHGIVALIDDKVAIAHNKVMIIDGTTVITGSFNFTEAAQKRNAENVLIIAGNKALADTYKANWQRRAAASRAYEGVVVPTL
jgi:phosphatidylserine/phosphatidylglycerophosphate/cardiolipin synthase-like enzyme